MLRGLLLLAFVLSSGCAEGDLDDETARGADASAQTPLVGCESGRLPKTGERCDPAEIPADGYCRLSPCSTKCDDECFCRSDGRWECRLFCRDDFGCGTPPLCGVSCAVDAGSSG